MSTIKDAKFIKEETTDSGKYNYYAVVEIELSPDHEITGLVDLLPPGGDNTQPINIELDFHYSTGSSRGSIMTVKLWHKIDRTEIGSVRHDDLTINDKVSLYLSQDGARDHGTKKRYRLKDSQPEFTK